MEQEENREKGPRGSWARTETIMAIFNLYNRTWANGLNVDVVIGNNPDCSRNRPLGAKNLTFNGAPWPIDVGTSDICYRRDRDPDNPDGSWNEWTTVSNLGHDKDIDAGSLASRETGEKSRRQKEGG